MMDRIEFVQYEQIQLKIESEMRNWQRKKNMVK